MKDRWRFLSVSLSWIFLDRQGSSVCGLALPVFSQAAILFSIAKAGPEAGVVCAAVRMCV